MKPKNKLTPKQAMFVSEYLVDFNGTQAAIRAGYSPKTANEQAAGLLAKTSIQQAIQAKQEKRVAKLDISAERLDREAARLAFFDIRKLYRQDGTLKAIHELDEDTARAISGIEAQVIGNEDSGVSVVRKYKTASKEKALELLYRRLGLLKDNVSGSVVFKLINALPDLDDEPPAIEGQNVVDAPD